MQPGSIGRLNAKCSSTPDYLPGQQDRNVISFLGWDKQIYFVNSTRLMHLVAFCAFALELGEAIVEGLREHFAVNSPEGI